MSGKSTWGASICLAAVLAIASCGSDSAVTYTIGGTVSGLNGTLTLQNRGSDDLVLEGDGTADVSFSFSARVGTGAFYDVTLLSIPGVQFCTLSNAYGAASDEVLDVQVTCHDKHFFGGQGEDQNVELWATDGTAEGTALVKNIYPDDGGPWSSYPYVQPDWRYVNLKGQVYFQADDGTNGSELWVSDGTATGTRMVKDINAGPSGSSVECITRYGDKVYFEAYDPIIGYELWVSDGTEAGTVLLMNIADDSETPTDSAPCWFAEYGGALYFSAYDGTGVDLWKTDGTAAGTVKVTDLGLASIQYLIPFAGKLYFRPNALINGSLQYELWAYDGATAAVAVDLNGDSSSSLWVLGVFDGALFFAATDSVTGRELYRSDGTQAGTELFELEGGPGGSNPYSFAVHQGKMYFSATTALTGQELWVSDGTLAGTEVLDVGAGSAATNPFELDSVGDWVVYGGTDATYGTELWRSDGTLANTGLLKNICPDNPTPACQGYYGSD